MTELQKSKSLARDAIGARGNEFISIARTVLANPETGYRETKTSKLVAEWCRANGLRHRNGIAKTGVIAELEGAHSGPTVAIFGELDSLIVPGHPFADPQTAAAHACGHHIQIGALLGAAAGLMDPAVRASLHGKVRLIAVPAEEGIEIEHRLALRERKEIEFLSGKQELVRLGELDGVDMAMMTHSSSSGRPGFGTAEVNGNIKKSIQFIGRAAHAGTNPEDGINALNAATLAIAGINAQRETFRDQDHVRVHPIITRGGVAVNAVPADVRLETYVRGSSLAAIRDASAKVDRAVRAGAMAVGAKVRITTLAGTSPSRWDAMLAGVWRENAEALVGRDGVNDAGFIGGSTDMADLSLLMPTIHPFVYAATGTGHGADYLVNDYDLAVVKSAQAMAMTVVDLLADGAAKASEVKRNFRPQLSRAEYLAQLRSFSTDHTYSDV